MIEYSEIRRATSIDNLIDSSAMLASSCIFKIGALKTSNKQDEAGRNFKVQVLNLP